MTNIYFYSILKFNFKQIFKNENLNVIEIELLNSNKKIKIQEIELFHLNKMFTK